jgi:hypothetical protein
MILASHGLIASQIASFDADAVAFFARVTAAGGTLSATEKIATNQLVLDLKANSLWTPMKAIYPMVGASAAACAQNLKSSSFTGTFTSGWTFASTGVTPNGTNAYMDTNCLSNNVFTQGNAGFAVYRRTINVQNGNSKVDFGAASAGVALPIIYFKGRSGNGNFESGMWSYNTAQGAFTNTANSQTIGFYQVHRTSTTLATGYNSGTSWITSTNSNTLWTPNIPRNMFLAAVNDANAGGGVDFNDCQYAFASISDGLNATQASNFYTVVQAMQVTLSRSV